MVNTREAIIRRLSDSIHKGTNIALHEYCPEPATTMDDVLIDATINSVLRALKRGEIPAFSGISGKFSLKKHP